MAHGAPGPPPPPPPPSAARIIAGIAAAIGTIALAGWSLDVAPLTRILPSLPAMQPNTALALVACGLSLALPPRLAPLAAGFALFSVAIGAVTMVEYGTGLDLGVDDAFLRGTLRMSPQTSISLTLLGLALLARRTPGREGLAQPLVALPALLCYVSVVGLLFRATVPVFPLAATMSLNTAVTICLVAFALVLSQPDRGLLLRWRSAGPGGRTLRSFLPVLVVLPPLLAVLREAGQHAGAYDEGFGIALQATETVALLGIALLLHSRSLDAAEEERAHQAERFRHIVEAMPEGVCVIDACGQVVYANVRLGEVLGRRAVPGLSLTDHVDPGARPVFLEFLRNAERGSARTMVAVRAEDDTVRFLRFSATPLPGPFLPRQGTTLLLTVDETARRVAEGRLRERAEALEQSVRDLEAFATLAAHDLREPLRKIQLLADLAAENTDTPPREALLRIRRSAARLNAGLAELLAYSRLGTAFRPVRGLDLGAIVREAWERLAGRFNDAHASLVVGALPTVDGDPSLLVELFVQLFDNAIACARPGVPPAIRVGSEPLPDGRMAVTVGDDGIGLDPEDAAQLFELFRPLHPRGRHPGTGIGLATCRRIVELHGGAIAARGEPKGGAVFTITLPIRSFPRGVPPECRVRETV